MFGSNVQPKKVFRDVGKDDWDCYKCDKPVKYYLTKCLTCGSRRSQDDQYRKGGA